MTTEINATAVANALETLRDAENDTDWDEDQLVLAVRAIDLDVGTVRRDLTALRDLLTEALNDG